MWLYNDKTWLQIEEVDIATVGQSRSLRIVFYVNIPGKHFVPKEEVKLVFAKLTPDELGDILGRQVCESDRKSFEIGEIPDKKENLKLNSDLLSCQLKVMKMRAK